MIDTQTTDTLTFASPLSKQELEAMLASLPSDQYSVGFTYKETNAVYEGNVEMAHATTVGKISRKDDSVWIGFVMSSTGPDNFRKLRMSAAREEGGLDLGYRVLNRDELHLASDISRSIDSHFRNS